MPVLSSRAVPGSQQGGNPYYETVGLKNRSTLQGWREGKASRSVCAATQETRHRCIPLRDAWFGVICTLLDLTHKEREIPCFLAPIDAFPLLSFKTDTAPIYLSGHSA